MDGIVYHEPLYNDEEVCNYLQLNVEDPLLIDEGGNCHHNGEVQNYNEGDYGGKGDYEDGDDEGDYEDGEDEGDYEIGDGEGDYEIGDGEGDYEIGDEGQDLEDYQIYEGDYEIGQRDYEGDCEGFYAGDYEIGEEEMIFYKIEKYYEECQCQYCQCYS